MTWDWSDHPGKKTRFLRVDKNLFASNAANIQKSQQMDYLYLMFCVFNAYLSYTTTMPKWVSFELLKFILGSGAEGNKTGTRKGTRNLWFPRNRISYDFTFLLKGSKKTVVSIPFRKNLLSGDLFSEKVGGRLPNEMGRRSGWSQFKPEFAKIKVEQRRVNVVLQDL